MTAPAADVRWSGRHAVVTMPAELDVINSSAIHDLLAAVAVERPDVLTADLSGTIFCDSAGVHTLARAHRLVAANGGELRLAVGGSPCTRILELTGLDQVLPIYRTVQESLLTSRAAPGGGPDARA